MSNLMRQAHQNHRAQINNVQPADAYQRMNNALNAPVNGSYENMVKVALQQNPQLAQEFKATMERYGNVQNPWQVLELVARERGVDLSRLGIPRK